MFKNHAYMKNFAEVQDTLIEESILQILQNILHKIFLNENKVNMCLCLYVCIRTCVCVI